MMLVYQATREFSPQNLSFCTKFIHKVAETFVWDVGCSMTLRVISRFHALECTRALTYVFSWTLYIASRFGEYDIKVPEFLDIPPPGKIFLFELRTARLEYH